MFMGAIRTAFPLLTSATRVLPLPWVNQAVESTRRQARLAGSFLDEYKRLVDSAPGEAPQTLFSGLVRAERDDKMTHDEMRNEAELYIIAGSDTSANTLTYLVWAVCRRPDVQRALVAELQTLPDYYGGAHLRDLPYLNRVVDESLRLYSAAPSGLPRVVPPGGADVCRHFLEQGTTVCAQAWTLHRDPDTFPRPDEFDPTRWEAPTKAMRDAFMPFGRGPRGTSLTCLPEAGNGEHRCEADNVSQYASGSISPWPRFASPWRASFSRSPTPGCRRSRACATATWPRRITLSCRLGARDAWWRARRRSRATMRRSCKRRMSLSSVVGNAALSYPALEKPSALSCY